MPYFEVKIMAQTSFVVEAKDEGEAGELAENAADSSITNWNRLWTEDVDELDPADKICKAVIDDAIQNKELIK